MPASRRWLPSTLTVLLLAAVTEVHAQDITVRVLSSRPDMVTGGNALVEITGLREGEAPVAVSLGNRTITTSFRATTTARTILRGRVEGLPVGRSVIEARAGTRRGRIEVTNHPITGPVFSGPHQTPFICGTEAAGLGPARDANCSADTVVQFFYRSTDPPPAAPARGADAGARGATPPGGPERGRGPAPGAPPNGFKRIDPTAARPTDIARTTVNGRSVEYIIRHERGTINRAIYEIAFLSPPGELVPDPWSSSAAWNGRLVYTFGGGCAAGYRQGGVSSAMNDALLSAGYAVAASSLNVFGTNCDHVISAETMMMVKEHFIERFGVPVYTIGNGGSGGSMQQHLIAQNYPGLLDGLTPTVSYPDAMSVVMSAVDCSAITRAMEGATEKWTEEQQRAVGGYGTWRVCGQTWARTSLHRAAGCNQAIPEAQRYHPVNNPTGARCSNYDNQVNVYGKDSRGFARRPLDNIGVQYGLVPFNAGVITAAQFVELNEKAGGFDGNGEPTPQRASADPEALRRAYLNGIVNTGGGSLGSIPIIDSRDYRDPAADIHDSYRSFVTRARIAAANGGRADNHVILRTAPRGGAAGDEPAPAARPAPFNAIRLMDAWLTAIGADKSADPIQVKIARAKPSDLVDACWTPGGEKVAEPAVYGNGRCNELYPTWADTRMAAGSPLTDNVLKCTLKPFDARDYKQALTPDQVARLRAVFSTGVCDWTKPGVGEQVVKETWRRHTGS